MKKSGNLNNKRLQREVFDPKCRQKLLQSTRLRRNVYLVLFLVGNVCIFISGFAGRALLTVLSLFLATLSLVVMTKYDTQVLFLKILEKKGSEES